MVEIGPLRTIHWWWAPPPNWAATGWSPHASIGRWTSAVAGWRHVQCKIRYKAQAVDCTLHPLTGDRVEVRFDATAAQHRPRTGRIFYDGDMSGRWTLPELKEEVHRDHDHATIRDIAIIMVALESFVVLAMLGILIWQISRLIKMLQTEVRPIIQDTQETLATLRGTTKFVAETS